ncbi:hypothetical protein P389DRAFT_154019 [Cystobasidium minutum MCA 4210]|uniref:uncharacterized protein n=1 Tax=Cystobasidium minutum MCA 4210 TaxID=1397322 RepID=UPI0034CE767C|eukprot:jgi/Rhomi1/154019/estExt_Genewise1.C_5_t20023
MAARAMLRSSSLLRSGNHHFLQQPLYNAAATRAALRQSQRRTLFTRKTPAQRFKYRAWTAAGLVLGGLLAVYAYDSSAGIHRWLVIPLLHAWTKDDPEESHKIAIKVLASGLSPVDIKADQEDILGFDLWGKHFSNPVGLAAGFDKHGEAIDGLFNLGFGYVEIGSITPEPQDGNPKPRFFRLPSSQSVINRYGFNSDGHLAVLERLRNRVHAWLVKNANILPEALFTPPEVSANPDPDPVEAILSSRTDAQVLDQLHVPRSLVPGKVLAINLGKNKASAAESITDYVAGVQTLGPYADVLVINVSSPNTPGLRSLQRREIVQSLLEDVVKARNDLKSPNKPPVVLKIAPDLSKDEVADIGAAAKASKIDGIIVSNTTISRPLSAGIDPVVKEAGGLSGPPVKPLALRVLETLYALTDGEIPLIGCGGISTGQDALDYARAGASFVQLYTALGYQGVGLPRMIKDEIVAELKQEGKTWKDVVGAGIDLAGIQALGREYNPASVLSLEEEASDGIERLKHEVEAVLSGKKAELPPRLQTYEERMAAFLPDWSDYSPVTAAHSTVPAATSATTATQESGMVPPGYPQIVILSDDQHYSDQVKPLTQEDIRRKWEETKAAALHAEHVAEDAIRGAAAQSAAAARELGHEVRQELHEVAEVTRDAAEESAAAFRELGRDIRDDQFAKDLGRATKDAAKESEAAFRQLGRDIENDQFARQVGEVTRDAARESAQGFREIGRDIRDDQFAHQVGEVTRDAAKESAQGFREIGRDIRDDRFAHELGHLTKESAKESASAFRELGHEMKHDPLLRDARDVSERSARESAEHFREIGRDIKHDPLLREAQDVTERSARESGRAFREVGHDIKHDPFLHEARDVTERSAEESARAFKEVGRDIKHDPLLDEAKDGLKDAKKEAEYVKERFVREGARGEEDRSGGGIWSLFSTFGERANVTSESKRQV